MSRLETNPEVSVSAPSVKMKEETAPEKNKKRGSAVVSLGKSGKLLALKAKGGKKAEKSHSNVANSGAAAAKVKASPK